MDSTQSHTHIKFSAKWGSKHHYQLTPHNVYWRLHCLHISSLDQYDVFTTKCSRVPERSMVSPGINWSAMAMLSSLYNMVRDQSSEQQLWHNTDNHWDLQSLQTHEARFIILFDVIPYALVKSRSCEIFISNCIALKIDMRLGIETKQLLCYLHTDEYNEIIYVRAIATYLIKQTIWVHPICTSLSVFCGR